MSNDWCHRRIWHYKCKTREEMRLGIPRNSFFGKQAKKTWLSQSKAGQRRTRKKMGGPREEGRRPACWGTAGLEEAAGFAPGCPGGFFKDRFHGEWRQKTDCQVDRGKIGGKSFLAKGSFLFRKPGSDGRGRYRGKAELKKNWGNEETWR